jgi:hypothetical protein
MKIRQKLAILAVAALLTIFGFSLMAGPYVELIKTGNGAGTQALAGYLVKADVTVHAHQKG